MSQAEISGPFWPSALSGDQTSEQVLHSRSGHLSANAPPSHRATWTLKNTLCLPYARRAICTKRTGRLLTDKSSSCWKHSYSLMNRWSGTRWKWYIIKPKPVITVSCALVIGTLGPLNNQKESVQCSLRCVCSFGGTYYLLTAVKNAAVHKRRNGV